MAKLAVVTGGSKGIGRAILEKFAASGFDICTCSRTSADLEKLGAEWKARFGVNVFTKTADLSNRADTKVFTDYVLSLKRDVDLLVNNAGYFIPGQIINEDEEILEKMLSANLLSAYHTTRALVPPLVAAKGHIFNMCSIASIVAYPNGGSYTISKFALLGFSKVLREELKQSNVRVTAVLPGATLTASWEGTSLPEERFMSSEDVAEAIWSAYSLSKRSVVEEIIIRPQLGDL